MWFITYLLINLRRRLARSMLTIGGIALAVGTAVALLGISEGFQRSAAESLGSRGVEILVMQEGVLDQLSSDLDENIGERLLKTPGVADISPGLLELLDFSKQSEVISVLVQGWQSDTFMFGEMKFLAGGPFESDDRQVALLGKILAESIDKKVGDKIVLQREEFEIVGIYDSFSVFENGAITVPLKQLQRLMVRDNSVTGFSIRVDRSADGFTTVEDLCNTIDHLKDSSGKALGLNAMQTQDYVNSSMYLRMTHAMAWMTSLIAVAVGTLGMLNTMLMSVVERVREISILRALGWRRSRIVRMILGESLMMCLAGGVLGAVVAVLATRWLTQLPAVSGFIRADIAPVVVAMGIALAVAVALIGGVYPAYRAARLRPAEGISHE